ncbi:MAG: M28 family metallopeptidase [Actinomycetota bacterium]
MGVLRRGRRAGIAALAATVLVGPLALATPALADGEERGEQLSRKLQKAVTLEGVQRHLEAFADIAAANGGTRVAGAAGYEDSRGYVKRLLERAGYNVADQEFSFPYFQQTGPTEVAQVSPTPTTYVDGTDFVIMTYSGSGDVTGTVQAVDVVLPPSPTPNTSTSGCEAADFAGFTPGNIALLQRGACTFAQKAVNAQNAGASAVLIFNEGQPGRTAAFAGTLGGPVVTIPVVGTSFALGSDLADPPGTVARVKTQTVSEQRLTRNLIAESQRGRTDNVVMMGTHLDSVPEGPGINDNGSGSAALLEVALQMAKVKPWNKLRFAWWSAEEFGLLGSEAYVAALTPAQLDDIAMYLNFDMIGSPNFARFVYDGDDSDRVGAGPGPAGSAAIERLFVDYFAGRGLPTEGTDFDGRSDYGPFIAAGVPAGGLFTGAEGIKTPAQAARYGGTAGQAFDPCYHQTCDGVANISGTALDQNADAMAHAVATYAFDTSSVNGIGPRPPHGKGKVHGDGHGQQMGRGDEES